MVINVGCERNKNVSNMGMWWKGSELSCTSFYACRKRAMTKMNAQPKIAMHMAAITTDTQTQTHIHTHTETHTHTFKSL